MKTHCREKQQLGGSAAGPWSAVELKHFGFRVPNSQVPKTFEVCFQALQDGS